MRRIPVLVVASAASAVTTAHANNTSTLPSYTVIDLGTLVGRAVYPHAIANDGSVVVSVRDEQGVDHSGVWRDGAIMPLPWLAGTSRGIARAMSDDGVVGGSCGPWDALSATVWTEGQPTSIGTLGGTLSDIMHISESGNITGYSRPFKDQSLWHGYAVIDGVMHDLGPMPHYDVGSASVINDAGLVAGRWTNHKDQEVPFVWTLEHGIRELPHLGGFSHEVLDINNSGQIVGHSSDGVPEGAFLRHYPVRWEADGRITALPTMPGLPTGTATGINAAGDAVGKITNNDTDMGEAVIWINGTVYMLNELVPAGSGWNIGYPTDINDAGQIVGRGTINGQTRAFILQPN